MPPSAAPADLLPASAGPPRVIGQEIAGEHETAEWQASGGPTMFARIGVMRALNHGKPVPVLTRRRKPTKAYRIVR
jgi:hypothetical protein